jgi:hypothetical protein
MTILQIAFSFKLRPFKKPRDNKIEVLNEAIYYTVLALCFSFTYYNDNLDSMQVIGHVVNLLIYCMLALNVSVMIMATSILIFRLTKKFYIKSNAKYKNKQLNEFKIKKAAQLKAAAASRVFPVAEAKLI